MFVMAMVVILCVTPISVIGDVSLDIVYSLVDSADLDGASSVDISGNYAYVTASQSDSLTVIDISNPTSPTVVGSVSDSVNLDYPIYVQVSGNYAYITPFFSDSLTVIQINSIIIPGTPDGLSAISGDTQVSLSWTAPSDDGGDDITDYLVEYSVNGTTWNTFADGTSTETNGTVTDLTNNQEYSFRVSAVNSIGTGGGSI